jgi:hypothetical protein
MKFLNSPNGAFLYNSLISLLSVQGTPNTLIVEAVLTEMVKETMREKALFDASFQADPLQKTLSLVIQSIHADLGQLKLEPNLKSYAETTEARLKYGSREIAELSKAASEYGEFWAAPEPQISAQGVPYQVTKLSLGNQFSGILGFAIDGSTFNLAELQARYGIEGHWFPLVVPVEEFIFVVDYSSVLVNLKDVSPGQWTKAKDKLTEMMDTLIPP